MTRPRTRTSLGRRPVRVFAAAVTVSAIATALGWAVGSPLRALASCATEVRSGANVDTALVAAAGVAGWACLMWFAALVTLEAGAAAPGIAGAASARLAGHLGPRSARIAARWLIGVTMTAAPLVSTMAGPALAAVPSGSIVSGGTGTPLAPANLDRPIATAPASPPATASVLGTRSASLDRPAAVAGIAANGATDAGSVPAIAPTPLPRHEPTPTTSQPATSQPATSYVVRPGDTLWEIAARHLGPHPTAAAIDGQWPRWYAANRGVIGIDPNLIRPGEALRAPPT